MQKTNDYLNTRLKPLADKYNIPMSEATEYFYEACKLNPKMDIFIFLDGFFAEKLGGDDIESGSED